MSRITCNCTPYGTLHEATCPIGHLQLEMARRAQLGIGPERGHVGFSRGYLRRVGREELNALNGRSYLRHYVRPEVQRLASPPVEAPARPQEATPRPPGAQCPPASYRGRRAARR